LASTRQSRHHQPSADDHRAKGEAVMNWRWRLAWAAFFVVASPWHLLVIWAPPLLQDDGLPGQTIRGRGVVRLRVSVRPSGNGPVRSVSAEAFGSREKAEKVLESTCPPESDLRSATQQPFVGDDLVVWVPTSTTTAQIGLLRSSRRFQYQ